MTKSDPAFFLHKMNSSGPWVKCRGMSSPFAFSGRQSVKLEQNLRVLISRVLISGLLVFSGLWGSAVSGEDAPPGQSAMMVLIFDTHCKTACELVRPIMRDLKGEMKDCFTFVELDSSAEKLAESQKAAKELGVHGFLADYAQFVPIVGVFTAKKKCIKVIQGPKNKDVYMAALQKALQCK